MCDIRTDCGFIICYCYLVWYVTYNCVRMKMSAEPFTNFTCEGRSLQLHTIQPHHSSPSIYQVFAGGKHTSLSSIYVYIYFDEST